MSYSNDVIALIEDLRNRTTTNISSIHKGLIPEFVDIKWKIVDYYYYDNKRYDNYDSDVSFIRLNNVRFKPDNANKDKIMFIEDAMTAATTGNKVNPFLLFINGQCIKWSDITIVRELKYTYFVIKNTGRFGTITDIQMLHIPFNIYYTENRKFNQDHIQLFRFNDAGLVAPYGKIVITTDLPDLVCLSDTHLEGATVKNVDIDLNTTYKITEDNFFVFKNKKLCRDLPIKVYNLNVLTLNDGEPLEGEYDYKILYRAVINENISNITIPYNSDYLKKIITGQEDAENIDINTLETDFDFQFTTDRSYDQNLLSALQYIHMYRQDLVNSVYEKRSIVRTLAYTGKEIKAKLDKKRNLRMLRWKYEGSDTFVMVFKNNLLHERYRDLHYEANAWIMPILEDIEDDDRYEIVFFRFCNNTIIEQTMKADDNWVTHCPIKPDELQITSPYIPDHFYGLNPMDRTQYKLNFSYTQEDEQTYRITLEDSSYYEKPDGYTGTDHTTVNITPELDPGIELTMDSKKITQSTIVDRDELVRFEARYNDSTEFTQLQIETTPFSLEYLGQPLYLSSTKQFRYVYYNVQEKGCMFRMSPDFITCLDPDRYMVFINGRMLTSNMYKLLIETKNNAFLEPCIHSRVMLDEGDRIEIFYLPCDVPSVDIGTSNQTEIVKVTATTNNQAVFNIPFPFDNYMYGKNSFMVIYGTLILDPARYNVIGNTLVFIDKNDYVDKGRDLTFIFFYTKGSSLDELEFVEEEDHIILDTKYVIATSNKQTRFTIPWPTGTNFIPGENKFFLTYRGLYINEERYSIDSTLTYVDITYDEDYIEYGSALVFTFFYPQNSNKITTQTIPVAATVDNQTTFDIPAPIENWFSDYNKFFVTMNGTFIERDKDYTIDTNTKTLTLNSTEGLDIGEEILFTFNYGTGLSIKATTVELTATREDQTRFKLPSVFDDYIEPGNKFFLIIGTTFVDPRRYEIADGYLTLVNDFDAQPRGATLSFLVIYTEDIRYTAAIDLDFTAANKYTRVESTAVKATTQNQRTFTVPKENAIIFDKKFFITIGSTFLSDTLYTTNPLTNSITLSDEVEVIDKGREVLFTFIENDYLVVEQEFTEVFAEADGQMEFDIELPFSNFLELGNKLLVFNGRTFLDEDRYVIDEEAGTLTLLDYEDALDINRKLVYLFVYIANQQNTSYERDDVSAVKIQEYGYIYLAKDNVNYALDKKLYFLFMNGKKVDLDSIIDVAANIIRLKRDLQTRYNICIIDYTPQIEEFKTFARILSTYDQLINKLEYNQLNRLFNIYRKTSDTEPKFTPDISQEAIINDIIRYHYVAQGISEGLPFVYTYDHNTLRVIDEYGNYIPNVMDANDTNNPDYEHYVN